VDGVPIAPGLTITQERADQLLQADLRSFEQGVESSLTRPATQDQFDALVAFSYNVGLGAFRGSTLLRLFNLGDPHGTALQFIEWSHDAAGNLLLGLARRRCAEIVRFYGG
jgi:lysozyme